MSAKSDSAANTAQLKALSTEELKDFKEKAEARKKELLKLKAKGGDSWTPELQDELEEIAMSLVDIAEEIEGRNEKEAEPSFQPKGRAKKMIHVRLVRGQRFDSNTGKELSKPFVQLFTFGEWRNFEKHHQSLGYKIVEVIFDPYKIAKVD